MTRQMIRIDPDPLLHIRSKEVEAHSEEFIEELVSELIEVTNMTDAVGFSAPQIGVSLRVIVYQDHDGQIKELINPVVTPKSKIKDLEKEGCMSLPEIFLEVERYKQIQVVADTLEVSNQVIVVSGFPARVIQHEVDHLDGILITDRHEEIKHKLAFKPRL